MNRIILIIISFMVFYSINNSPVESENSIKFLEEDELFNNFEGELIERYNKTNSENFSSNSTKENPIPEYLSITANSTKVKSMVYYFIQKSLEQLLSNHQKDKEILIDYLNIFVAKDNKFKNPDSWHTTCLYIGDDISKLNSSIYQNFKEGITLPMKLSTFVYIPGKIMVAPVFYDNFNLIENKYPHVTLAIGEYRAVDSNYVLKAVFESDKQLEYLYKHGQIKQTDFKLDRKLTNVTINFEDLKQSETVERVYILKFGIVEKFEGITTKNYKN